MDGHEGRPHPAAGTSSPRSSASTASDRTTEAGSGHPTSSLSAAHLTAVLFADHLRTDLTDPRSPANDRFVLSKGHAAPLLYAALKAIGAIDDEMLLSLRRFGSPIQGHPAPVPELPWVDAATGSLGQGPAIGLGMALGDAARREPRAASGSCSATPRRPKGSVWEAMEAASYHGVSNLVCVLDLNRLGQRGPTMHGWDADVFVARAEAFGWHALVDRRPRRRGDRRRLPRGAEEQDRPTMIVARTEKGHGVSLIAEHGGLARQGARRRRWPSGRSPSSAASARSRSRRPSPSRGCRRAPARLSARPRPPTTSAVATRKAFGEALAWLAGERADLVVLDGEVGNSTYTEDVEAVAPERFFQMYIAEQTHDRRADGAAGARQDRVRARRSGRS